MENSPDRRKGVDPNQSSPIAEDYQATTNTLARLQRELDRWKAGPAPLPPEGRSRLHLELERERLMRVEAELNRLEEASQLDTPGHRPLGPDVQLDSRTGRPPADMPVDANGCRSRPPDMQLDSNTCRARLHALQEDFRKMEEMVASMVQYKAKIDQLKQENASMKSSYEANLRKYCSHISRLERDNMVLMNQAKNMESQIHGKGDDRDKSKLLLERLRMVEAENSSLVLENEQQRQQYEKCLDEIANQVVQALLAQKTLREECLKLQARVQDLELQNKHLNLMFQQRMRITSNDSVGNITLTFNDNGGSLHSMCSEIMGDDSPGKPQLSSPPSWMQEKMAPSPGPEGNLSPSSSSSCSAPSPSTPDSQDQVLRTKIETEFPATNASPKMKHVSVFERRSRSLERGSSGPLGWAQKMLKGGRRRSESQEKNYPHAPKLKQSTSADALTHYGVKNKISTSLSQTSIDTSSWRDSLSQERLCAKDAKLLLRTSSTGNGKGELSSQVCDINHQSFEAFNRSFEKLLAKKLPDEKQKESSKSENQKDSVNNARQTSTVPPKKLESTTSDKKSKPKTFAGPSTTSSVKSHPSGHHQKVRPSPALRNPFADPLKSPKSPSPIPGQYYYYDYSDEDSDSRPVSRDFSTASTMSLNEILDSSTEGEVPLDDDFFSDWSSVCISPQKRIDRLTGQTISNNALVSMLQKRKSSSSSVSQSTSSSSSSSSPDSSKLSAAGINSSTVIRASTTSSKANNKAVIISRPIKQKAEPIYDTPYVPKTVPSPVISKTVSQQAVTRSLVENSPFVSNANTTQVTAEVHADSSFHPSPSLSPNPSQLSQDQGYASKGSYSQSSPSPSPSLSHRGTPPWLHSTKDPHSFSRNELLTLVINREALSSSPRAIPSGTSPGDSPRLTRPGKLILVPEDKNYNIQGFSSVSSTSSEDKSPIKMFESRHNEDMKSSVIEMKKGGDTPTSLGQAKNDGQNSLPRSSMPESPSSPQSKDKIPPPVAKKPVKAVKPEARSPSKDASTSPRDKYGKIPNPNNNNNVTVGFLLHNQHFPAQQSPAMDFLVSSMIKEVKNQVFKQHPELGNPFQTKICQSSDSSFENLRVERSGSKDDGYSTMSSDIHPEIMEKFCDTLTWKLLESEADNASGKSASLKMKGEGSFLKERRNSDSVINTKDRSIELISDQDSAMDSSLHSTAEMATSSSSQVSNSSTDVTSPSSTNVSRIAKLFECSPVKSNAMKVTKPCESMQSSPLRSPSSPKTPVPSCFQQPESPRRLANEFQKPTSTQAAGASKKKASQVNPTKPLTGSSKQTQQSQKSSPLENGKEKKELPSKGIPVLSSVKRNESKPKASLTNEQTKEKSQNSSGSLPRTGTAVSKNSSKSTCQVQPLTRRKSIDSNEASQKNESGNPKVRSSRNVTSSPAPDKKNLTKGNCVPGPSSSTKRQKKNDGRSKAGKTAAENLGSSNQSKLGSSGKGNKNDNGGRPPTVPNTKDMKTDGCGQNNPLILSTATDLEKHNGDLKSTVSTNSNSSPTPGETSKTFLFNKGSNQSQTSSPDSASKKPFIVLTNQCFQLVSSDSDGETDNFRPSYVMTETSSFQCKNVPNTSEEFSSSGDSSVSLSWQHSTNNNNPISTSASPSDVTRNNPCTNFSNDIAASNNEDTKVPAPVSNSRPYPCLPNVASSSSSSTFSIHSPKQWDLLNGSQYQHFSTAQSYTSSSTSSSNSDFPSKTNSLHQSKDNDIPCLWRSRSEHSVLGSRPKSTSCIESLYEQAWDSGKLLERSTSDSEIDTLSERLQANCHTMSPDENVFHQKCLTSVMTTEKNFNYAPNQSHYFHRFHGFHNVYRYSHQRADAFHPVTHSLRLDLSDVTELDEESSELASTRDSMDASSGQLGSMTGDESPRLIADEQKQFNSQFYSLCQMGSSKSLLSSSYGSGEKLSLTSLNDALGNKSFERESEGDAGQLSSEDRIAIKEFDEISRQIASLSKTVDELNHSLSSLNSGEFETSHTDTSTGFNKSSGKCDVIDGYHWVDDEMYLTSCNGELISEDQDLPRDSFADIFNASTQNSSSDLNSTEDARDEFCMVPVSQRSSIKKYLNVPDATTETKKSKLRSWDSEGNLSCEPNSVDKKKNRLSVPVFWKSSDRVDNEINKSNGHSSSEQTEAGEKCHSSMGSNMDSDDSLASDIGLDHMMCQRLIGPKGRISHTSARPVVDLSTLFHHYEESEKEAIAAFDFLDNVSVAESNADGSVRGRSEKVDSEDSVEQVSSVAALDNQHETEEDVCIKIEISAANSSNLAVKETRDIGLDAMSRSQASLTNSFEICNDPYDITNKTASSSSSLSLSFANQSYAASDESKLIPPEYQSAIMAHGDYCNTTPFLESGASMDIVSCGGCTAKTNTLLSMSVAEKQSCIAMDRTDVTSYSDFVADLKMHAFRDSSPPDLPPRCPLKSDDAFPTCETHLPPLPPPLPQRSYAMSENAPAPSAVPRRTHIQTSFHHHTYHSQRSFPGQKHPRQYNPHAPYVNQTIPRSSEDRPNPRLYGDHIANRNKNQPEITHTQDGRPQVMIRPQRVQQDKKFKQIQDRPHSFTHYPTHQVKSDSKSVSGHAVTLGQMSWAYSDGGGSVKKVKGGDKDENSLSKIPKRKLKSRRERSLRKKNSLQQNPEGISNVAKMPEGAGEISHSWRDISAENGLPLSDSSGADNSSS